MMRHARPLEAFKVYSMRTSLGVQQKSCEKGTLDIRTPMIENTHDVVTLSIDKHDCRLL